jgi:uncharacterized protein (DUF1499 family)
MSTPATNKVSRIAVTGFAAALFAVLRVGAAGPVYRLKFADLGSAFSLIRWGAWLGLGAAVIAVAGAWVARPGARNRGFWLALAGVVLGGVAFGVPFAMLHNAKQAPPIHDIATDTRNPPQFVAVVPLRSDAPNAVVYEGEAVAKQQHAAYPDIQPATLAALPEAAFQRALNSARDLGWEIVAAVPDEGRIEATDTTGWFGFKDDIVIRVSPDAAGSRVDVRSLSRLGKSDLGKNAARVRAYLRRLQQ